MINKKETAAKLLQVEAVKLRPENPFTWASGWKSPIYCDNRRVLSFPFVRDFIKSEICDLAFSTFGDAKLLSGVATGGIAWGAMAADQLKLPFIYVRSQPKNHGMGNQIEGVFSKGDDCLVIEDLVSTGKSSLEVVEALRKAELNVIGMISLFQYGFDKAKDAFEAAGVKLYSLTDYTTLIAVAVEKGLIHEKELDLLENWRKHPETWSEI